MKDFEEELVDRTHRSFVNQVRQRIVFRSMFVFLFLFVIGSISPNFFVFSDAIDSPVANASFEEDYSESILLSIDGFLTKTYAPTEESKGASGIFTIAVSPGDTLSGIAQRYGVTVRDVVLNNDLSPNQTLKPGQKLLIANGIIHEVQKKDNAETIAKAYGVDKDKMLASNEILEKELRVGMQIVITDAKSNLPTFSTPKSGKAKIIANIPAGELPSLSGDGKLLFPTIGKYTQYFRPGHYAVDIANNQSPEVVAAEAGIVEKSQCGWNGGYGCHVIINHGNGFKTLYGHMRKLNITVGEQVVRGQDIGQMGATGRVYGKTGIHLHFEVIINGVKRNPLAFF